MPKNTNKTTPPPQKKKSATNFDLTKNPLIEEY